MDSIGRPVQVTSISFPNGRTLAEVAGNVAYPGQAIDPELRFFPIAWSRVVRGERLPGYFGAVTFVHAVMIALLGPSGAYVVTILAGLGAVDPVNGGCPRFNV